MPTSNLVPLLWKARSSCRSLQVSFFASHDVRTLLTELPPDLQKSRRTRTLVSSASVCISVHSMFCLIMNTPSSCLLSNSFVISVPSCLYWSRIWYVFDFCFKVRCLSLGSSEFLHQPQDFFPCVVVCFCACITELWAGALNVGHAAFSC